MIEFSEIKQNKDNFYTLSELELLADDIERQGLKHNLVVCKDSAGAGYWLISGHRRYSAIKLLIEQNRLKSTLVPCYVDGERTQAEAMLNLIMLNATQRKYTDAETMAEYEMLKQTIQQLEDEGKPVKGRIREIIAKTLNVSPAQVGKIENIRNNAIDEVHVRSDAGKPRYGRTVKHSDGSYRNEREAYFQRRHRLNRQRFQNACQRDKNRSYRDTADAFQLLRGFFEAAKEVKKKSHDLILRNFAIYKQNKAPGSIFDLCTARCEERTAARRAFVRAATLRPRST